MQPPPIPLPPDLTDLVALAARRDEASTRLMTIFRQTGSREAFGLLYRLNAPPILRSLERRLPRQAPGVDPSDVIQDAFLSVLLYPRRFEPRGERAFRVWMRAIVANSVRRRLCRTPRRLSFVDGAALNEVKEDAPGPSDTARDSEEAAGLRRAWWLLLLLYLQAYRALRPREKSRLHLVEIRGLDYATAASRTGETYNNFKMGVFRARRRILRAMERSLSSYRTRTKCTKLEPRRSG